MVLFVPVWSCMILYGPVLSRIVPYCLVWSRKVPYIWSHMVVYAPVGSCMVPCVFVWSRMKSLVWILAKCVKKWSWFQSLHTWQNLTKIFCIAKLSVAPTAALYRRGKNLLLSVSIVFPQIRSIFLLYGLTHLLAVLQNPCHRVI